jgi:hypothetical protein
LLASRGLSDTFKQMHMGVTLQIVESNKRVFSPTSPAQTDLELLSPQCRLMQLTARGALNEQHLLRHSLVNSTGSSSIQACSYKTVPYFMTSWDFRFNKVWPKRLFHVGTKPRGSSLYLPIFNLGYLATALTPPYYFLFYKDQRTHPSGWFDGTG